MQEVDINKIRTYLADKHIEQVRGENVQRQVRALFSTTIEARAQVAIILEDDQQTIWKALIQLFESFIADYWNGSKFVFKIWDFTKHGRNIKNLRDFFVTMKELI